MPEREQEIICIGCPLGCRVTVKADHSGSITDMTGNQCKEGKEYVTLEFRDPVRVLTATLLTEGTRRLLSVRTDKPVYKSQLKEVMRAIAKVKITPPVKVGEVIIHNILGTGANLVATSEHR